MNILELRNTVSEIKKPVDVFNSILDMAQAWITDPKTDQLKYQTEDQRKKKV